MWQRGYGNVPERLRPGAHLPEAPLPGAPLPEAHLPEASLPEALAKTRFPIL